MAEPRLRDCWPSLRSVMTQCCFFCPTGLVSHIFGRRSGGGVTGSESDPLTTRSTVRIEYEIITRDRVNDVVEVLLKNFFKEEPLGKSIGVNPNKDVRPWLADFLLPLICQGMSWMAMESTTGRIAGVMINRVTYKNLPNVKSFDEVIPKDKNNKMWDILAFMNVLYKDLDLQSHYNVEKLFVFLMMSVDSNFLGRGIGREMLIRSERHARRHGFEVLTAETTGICSANIFQKLGYTRIREKQYKDYVDKEGKPVFKDLEPHKSCIVWVKKVGSKAKAKDPV